MFRNRALMLAFVLCVAASSAWAQADATNPGNITLAGAMSWNSQDPEGATERINTWTLAPRAMYFVAQNFAIGAQMDFVGQTFGDIGTSAHRYLGLAQYVVPTSNSAMRPWAEVGAGFVRQTVETPATEAHNGWGLRAGVGAYMFLNEHVAIMPQLAYTYESFGDDGAIPGGTNQTIYLGLGMSGFLLP